MTKKPPPTTPTGLRKALIGLIRKAGQTHGIHRVFEDFVEMSALAIANKFDLSHYASREARYLEIIGRYKIPEDRLLFPHMLALLTREITETKEDVLGALFHDLELENKYRGQYFTPWHLAAFMARMTTDASKVPTDDDFMTIMEPCCGAGVLILAMADTFTHHGWNYASQMHVQAVDIDPKCVHMTYIQCSLLGIPAVVHLGNTLAGTFTETWITPCHFLNRWTGRLHRKGHDTTNAAWWREASFPTRIGFLKREGLDVENAMTAVPNAAVLDAAYRSERLQETA
jgi:hypothetical protein